MQAWDLAEAGSNHAISELRKRARIDLNLNIQNVAQGSVILNYFSSNDALGFLRDYAFSGGGTQFSISGGEAVLAVSPIGLNSLVEGSYSANLIVKQNGAVTKLLPDVYVFPYVYTIDTIGPVTSINPALQKSIRLTQGSFNITVRRDNFAKYALFTSHHQAPGGTTVWFTDKTNFNGPVATNERFSFALNPSGHFTEEVSQHQNTARFYNNGNSIFLNADKNGTRDVPVFDKEFTRGVGIVNLESSISQADLKNEALGGNPDPGSNGIYVVNDGTNLTGGIFVKSNKSNISVTMSVNGSDNAVYNITQDACIKTVTVDYANNQTTVSDCEGGGNVIYQGIPDGTQNQGVLIYANNDIVNFSRTVQENSNITVASE